MKIILRKATEQDAQLLYKIGMESYLYHFAKRWKNADELASYVYHEYSPFKIISDMQQSNIEWFVIENSQPIGLVKLTYHSTIPDETIQEPNSISSTFYLAKRGKAMAPSYLSRLKL